MVAREAKSHERTTSGAGTGIVGIGIFAVYGDPTLFRLLGEKIVMALVKFVEYADAGADVQAVYDDIMKTRGIDWINNFWKALANNPAQLRRIWENVKEVMAPGALDPLVKEMVYVAVSATNGCEYCTYSHTAAARNKGMTDAMLMELMAIVGLANDTNRFANGLRVDVDPQFKC
jgi:AhpD family alkylhydroperoxidase